MSIIEEIRIKFEALIPYMDERLRRLWAGSEAVALGREGIKTVAFATGLSTKTISRGIQELKVPLSQDTQELISARTQKKVRQPGGGRKSLSESVMTQRNLRWLPFVNGGKLWVFNSIQKQKKY